MFRLPPLPYPPEALAPTISEATMRTHHDKHHARYVETTNALLGDRGEEPASLESVIREAAEFGDTSLFNQAAQAWNHAFFWSCMSPAETMPEGALLTAVESTFGDIAGLRKRFIDA